MMESAATTTMLKARSRPPSLLACTACRKKHLKCDARMPICSRCVDGGIDCAYLQSRRGYKGPRKNPSGGRVALTSTSGGHSPPSGSELPESVDIPFFDTTGLAEHPIGLGGDPFPIENLYDINDDINFYPFPEHQGVDDFPQIDPSLATAFRRGSMPPALGQELAMVSDGSDGSDITPSNDSGSADMISAPARERPQPSRVELDHLTELYYHSMHTAHPVLVPRAALQQGIVVYPNYLKAVMHFAASHFIRGGPTNALRAAASFVTSDSVPSCAFKVQGMALFAMTLHARDEPEACRVTFMKAVDLALELGMNRADFAPNHAMGIPVLEESFRRTWWDQAICDGILSSLEQRPTPRLQFFAIESDVPLPCEESDYQLGRAIPKQPTIIDMQNRAFLDEDVKFSSFAYKIEATRVMETALNLGSDIFTQNDEQVEAVDASLSNFLLSLPQSKREVLKPNGKCDELMFSAHCIINCAIIFLHRPRSGLIFVRSNDTTACTAQAPIKTPVATYHLHTAKAVRAANVISNLASLQSPLAAHSPCFPCCLAMQAVVHLPAYSLETSTAAVDAVKERLQLAISALNTIGEVWPLARKVKQQVAGFAREVFLSKTAGRTQVVTSNNHRLDLDSMMNDDSWLDELPYLAPSAGSVPALSGVVEQ